MSPRHREHSRTVIVTGASAGIGRAIALRFARAGDRVGLIARDAAALKEVRHELALFGAEVAEAPADVVDADAVFAAADALERQLGPIDIWVNDAMETVFSPFVDMTPQEGEVTLGVPARKIYNAVIRMKVRHERARAAHATGRLCRSRREAFLA